MASAEPAWTSLVALPNQPRKDTPTSVSGACAAIPVTPAAPAAHGRSLGSVKCSEDPIENAGFVLPSTSNDVTCAAVRSVTMWPLRKAYPASSSAPATEARVPALPARRMSPRTK